jgi:hypothetical protein
VQLDDQVLKCWGGKSSGYNLSTYGLSVDKSDATSSLVRTSHVKGSIASRADGSEVVITVFRSKPRLRDSQQVQVLGDEIVGDDTCAF